jgi:PKD repeat protein
MRKHVFTFLLFAFAALSSFSQSGFIIERDSADTVYSYQFTPTVTLADSFYWTFGDGDSSFVTPAFHAYDILGEYKACLTILDTADTTVYCDSVIIECLEVSANIKIDSFASIFFFFGSHATNASGYIWDFGDGSPLDSTANPYHLFPWSLPGDTAQPCPWVVTLIVYNFCDTVTKTKDIYPNPGYPCNSSSISEALTNLGIRIFPNPSNTQLTLTSDKNFNIRNIKSINGQIVLSDFEKELSNQKEIEVSVLPSGLYFLEYEMAGIVKNMRFLIQH